MLTDVGENNVVGKVRKELWADSTQNQAEGHQASHRNAEMTNSRRGHRTRYHYENIVDKKEIVLRNFTNNPYGVSCGEKKIGKFCNVRAAHNQSTLLIWLSSYYTDTFIAE